MVARRTYVIPSISLEGSRFRSIDMARGRLALVGCVFVVAYVLLAIRLVDVSIIQHYSTQGDFSIAQIFWSDDVGQASNEGADTKPATTYTLDANSPELAGLRQGLFQNVNLDDLGGDVTQNAPHSPSGQIAEIKQAPKNNANHVRGDLVDRNGVLLARSLEMTSLYADPKLIQDPTKTAQALADLFPAEISDVGALQTKLQSKRRFIWVKRHLSPDEIAGVLRIGDPGLSFKKEWRRVYPQGRLAAHLVGYTDIDGKGIAGAERGFDANLQSSADDLALSMDIRVQHLLRASIAKSMARHDALGGAGLVMDVKTGEVLAAVSLPDFDPHHIRTSNKDERFNRFSLGQYELGSTFKIFSTAGYLDLPKTGLNDHFDVRKPMKKYGHTIRDYHGKKTVLTLPEVFIYSSNIGSAQMGEALQSIGMRQLFDDLALSDRLNIALPERGQPLLPEPWRPMNTLTAAYGHGVAVSPLHLTAAAASIGYRGEYITPQFLKQNADDPQITNLGYQVVSNDTAEKMRRLMRLVVSHGTGSMANVPGYMVGGKTGTAEKSGIGGYKRDKLISSFFGMFPMDDPQYAVFVMVDEPKGVKQTYGYATGGWVAAPAVGDVIAGMGRILGVPKQIYADEDFLQGLDKAVRTDDDFDNGVALIPDQRSYFGSHTTQNAAPSILHDAAFNLP